MADSLLLFDVFGQHTTQKTARNVLRQPLSNENMGKQVLEGPVKPNEPTKKAVKPGEPKKSFLSNAGKALQGTPGRQIFSPRVVNASPMIYTEKKEKSNDIDLADLEAIQFTKPPQGFATYWDEFEPLFKIAEIPSPPASPPPAPLERRLSIDSFKHDDFSDYSMDSLDDEDLGLPDIY